MLSFIGADFCFWLCVHTSGLAPSWVQNEAPSKGQWPSPLQEGSGNSEKVPLKPRLLRKCHHILYCRDAALCCNLYVVVLLKLWAYCLGLNWNFKSKFFWVRGTHWTIFSECIRTFAPFAPWNILMLSSLCFTCTQMMKKVHYLPLKWCIVWYRLLFLLYAVSRVA